MHGALCRGSSQGEGEGSSSVGSQATFPLSSCSTAHEEALTWTRRGMSLDRVLLGRTGQPWRHAGLSRCHILQHLLLPGGKSSHLWLGQGSGAPWPLSAPSQQLGGSPAALQPLHLPGRALELTVFLDAGKEGARPVTCGLPPCPPQERSSPQGGPRPRADRSTFRSQSPG